MKAFGLAIAAVLAFGQMATGQEDPPELPGDEQVDLNAQLTVKVLGIADQADVWIDGQLAGKSGEAIAVTAGEHRVVVSHPKKMDVTFRTTLKKDDKKSLTVRLADGETSISNAVLPGDIYMPTAYRSSTWTALDALPVLMDSKDIVINGKFPGTDFIIGIRAWRLNARHVQSFEYYIDPGTKITSVTIFGTSGLPTSTGIWHSVAFVHAETQVLHVDNTPCQSKQLTSLFGGIQFRYAKGTKGKITLSNFEYVALPELPAPEGK